jgi:hypothetical protein
MSDHSPFHGENRGSIPLGCANDFKAYEANAAYEPYAGNSGRPNGLSHLRRSARAYAASKPKWPFNPFASSNVENLKRPALTTRINNSRPLGPNF